MSGQLDMVATGISLTGTRVYHELMVQSRDQCLESSGTALASGYHNFVQIKALRRGEWGLADIRKLDDGLRKTAPVFHYTVQSGLHYR